MPADLRRRFADFRRANSARTRVPENLRLAVLQAFAQGVSMTALRRELGMTAKQVEDWRRGARGEPLAGRPAPGRGGARVFEVADWSVVGERAAASDGAGEALELRLGTWSVVIRSTCP